MEQKNNNNELQQQYDELKLEYNNLKIGHDNLTRCFHLLSDLILGSNYYIEDQVNGIQGNIIITIDIIKKLRLNRPLNTFEEEYILKWTTEYGYNMDIIDIALKRSTLKSNAGFEYFDTLLTDWHSKGLNTPEEVNAHLTSLTEKNTRNKQVNKIASQLEYTQSTFDSLYDN